MVLTFLTDEIPIVYYGQEQAFGRNADPVRSVLPRRAVFLTSRKYQYNREPLWTSKYEKTNAYELISSLNKVCSLAFVFLMYQTLKCRVTQAPQFLGQHELAEK
jgi:hypothetical protein